MNSVNRNWAVGGWSPGKVKIFLSEFVGRCLLGAVDVCLDVVVVVCRGVGAFCCCCCCCFISLRKGDSMNFCFTRTL